MYSETLWKECTEFTYPPLFLFLSSTYIIYLSNLCLTTVIWFVFQPHDHDQLDKDQRTKTFFHYTGHEVFFWRCFHGIIEAFNELFLETSRRTFLQSSWVVEWPAVQLLIILPKEISKMFSFSRRKVSALISGCRGSFLYKELSIWQIGKLVN